MAGVALACVDKIQVVAGVLLVEMGVALVGAFLIGLGVVIGRRLEKAK